jgi:hypothetical protein
MKYEDISDDGGRDSFRNGRSLLLSPEVFIAFSRREDFRLCISLLVA